MRVLVCGGREVNNLELLITTLDQYEISHIISGGAQGVDTSAVIYAKTHRIPYTVYPANWEKYGKRAGYVRNHQMLEEGEPDWVIAFPGGKGTAMMVDIANRAGLFVKDLRNECGC